MPPNDDDIEFEIKIQDDPPEARKFRCRRPTHGELDVGLLARLYGVFCGYQKKIADLEQDPQPGAAKLVGNYVAIGGEAAEEMRDRIRKALGRICADPSAAELLDADAPGSVQRGIWAAEALFEVLAPPDRLPK